MDLPNELWLQVFKRLDGATLLEEVALVSKRMNALAKATKPGFTTEENNLHVDFSQELPEMADYVKAIHMIITEKSDLASTASILRKRPGIKKLTLLGDHYSSRGVVKMFGLKKDKQLLDAIVSQRHLTKLDIKHPKITNIGDFLMLRHSSYPKIRQNFSAPWTKEELRRLLLSNKSLTSLALPTVTASTFNFMLEDQDQNLKEWRQSVKTLDIAGLKQNWISAEPEVHWSRIQDFRNLTQLTAGRVNKQFWSVLPTLTNLKHLELDLAKDGLVELMEIPDESRTNSVSRLFLYCHNSIEWTSMPLDLREKLLRFFPMVSIQY